MKKIDRDAWYVSKLELLNTINTDIDVLSAIHSREPSNNKEVQKFIKKTIEISINHILQLLTEHLNKHLI